jgi:hypothetical protein
MLVGRVQIPRTLVLDVIGKDELRYLLEMVLGDLTLIPVIGQRVVNFSPGLSAGDERRVVG